MHSPQRPELVPQRVETSAPARRSPRTRTRSVRSANGPIYAWTDLTYLCTARTCRGGTTSRPGAQPDCANARASRARRSRRTHRRPASGTRCRTSTPSTTTSSSATSNRCRASTAPRRAGRCRTSSWIVPSQNVSEHPPASISTGVAYVTGVINAIMRSPDWELDRDLPGLGRLGRLLRPRRARRSSTRTATACACPAW